MRNERLNKPKGEYFILILTILIAIFGIVMQYSASMYTAMRDMSDAFYYVKKQSIALVFGIVAMLIMSRIKVDYLIKYRYVLLVVSYILLGLVFVPKIGMEKYGAKRWINLGFMTIQPSEIAKIILVVFLAGEMSVRPVGNTKGLFIPLIAMALMCVLIMLEPNMSITICIGLVGFIMLYIGGISGKHMAMLTLPMLILAPLLIILEPYRLKRMLAFLDPWAHPKGEGYQLIQSYYALGSGGLFGVGLFNSRQKYLFLPFAESDFIFSIIGEELGLFGSLIVILLFLTLVIYGMRTAMMAQSRCDAFLAMGISVLIAVQTALNIAVVSGAIPPTGLPLPLISHGGSSLVMYMAGIGIIRGVALRNRTNSGPMHTMY